MNGSVPDAPKPKALPPAPLPELPSPEAQIIFGSVTQLAESLRHNATVELEKARLELEKARLIAHTAKVWSYCGVAVIGLLAVSGCALIFTSDAAVGERLIALAISILAGYGIRSASQK